MKKIYLNQLGDVGRFGEDAAVKHLIDKGYTIRERNSVNDGHEIDIIAEDLRHIVFVEVKSRTVPKFKGSSRYGTPASAVTYDKQQRIISAARQYLKANRVRKIPRFDVIEVYVDKTTTGYSINKINHIPSAYIAGR